MHIKSIKRDESCINETANKKIEVLDIEKTLVRLGNKRDFHENLLKMYKKNYSNSVKELSDLIRNKQYDEIKRLIHNLKSVTGNIGAIKLNNFIIEFEKQYETYEEKAIEENLRSLCDLNEELLKAITKFISLDESEEKFIHCNFNFYIELEKLLVALGRARTKEIKESMNCLVENTQDTVFTTQINEIKKLLERYRFKEAKVIVEELMKLAGEANNG